MIWEEIVKLFYSYFFFIQKVMHTPSFNYLLETIPGIDASIGKAVFWYLSGTFSSTSFRGPKFLWHPLKTYHSCLLDSFSSLSCTVQSNFLFLFSFPVLVNLIFSIFLQISILSNLASFLLMLCGYFHHSVFYHCCIFYYIIKGSSEANKT